MIPERVFEQVEAGRRESLSQLVHMSGLTYSSIAKQTGVERRAVKRAADGEGIRYDTATRLEYFLDYYIRTQR